MDRPPGSGTGSRFRENRQACSGAHADGFLLTPALAPDLSGRGAGYPTPPPQIPACGFPAPGSRRRSIAIVGLDATDPQARCFSDMLSPAPSPEHALRRAFPSTGRLPSTISAADFSRLCSRLQRYYAAVRLLACSAAASSPRLPVAARDRASDCGPDEVSQVPTRSVRP
jgi:hypothetical protein